MWAKFLTNLSTPIIHVWISGWIFRTVPVSPSPKVLGKYYFFQEPTGSATTTAHGHHCAFAPKAHHTPLKGGHSPLGLRPLWGLHPLSTYTYYKCMDIRLTYSGLCLCAGCHCVQVIVSQSAADEHLALVMAP